LIPPAHLSVLGQRQHQAELVTMTTSGGRWSLREHGVCWRGRMLGTWLTWQRWLTLAGGARGVAPTGQAGPVGCRGSEI